MQPTHAVLNHSVQTYLTASRTIKEFHQIAGHKRLSLLSPPLPPTACSTTACAWAFSEELRRRARLNRQAVELYRCRATRNGILCFDFRGWGLLAVETEGGLSDLSHLTSSHPLLWDGHNPAWLGRSGILAL